MENSLVGKYFDFGQALEFLLEGFQVTNKDYNDYWRFGYEDGKFYITNINEEIPVDDHVIESVNDFSAEDVLSESWYIYE